MNTFLGIALICSFPLLNTTAGSEPPAPQELKPLVFLTGHDSKVDQRAFHRIGDEKELRKLWLSHLGQAEDDFAGQQTGLTVDFKKCLVLILFQGTKQNSRGLRVDSIEEDNQQITVRYDDISYQTLGGAVSVTPYGFLVLPKSDKPIVIEENVQSLKAQPPTWKERARLTVPGKAR